MSDQFSGSGAPRLLRESDPTLAVVVSTAGIYNSRYVFANEAYSKLVGLDWPAISDQHLVGSGAAIGGVERDRRLFLLDTAGSYRDETAVIRHSSGRTIEIVISAWRFTHAGVNLDLELLRSTVVVSPKRPSTYPASGAPQARLLPDFLLGLGRMGPRERRGLMLRMLAAIAEGAILLGMMMKPHMPAARYGVQLRRRLQDQIDDAMPGKGRVVFDFDSYDDEQIELALLEIAGEIWTLHRFSRDPWALMMLASLVEPYTLPP